MVTKGRGKADDSDSDGSRTIALRAELKPRLKVKWQKHQAKFPDTNSAFGGFVNDILEDLLRKEEFLENYKPHLSLEGHNANVLFIKDRKQNHTQTAQVYRHDNELWCELDDSQDCEHIHFALAIPEVAKLNIRQPKRES